MQSFTLAKPQEVKETPKSGSSTLAIVNHMKVFANEEGWIDEKSVHDACINIFHTTEKKAAELGKATMLVAAGLGIKGAAKEYIVPSFIYKGTGRFTAEDAAERGFNHPHDTGLFTMAGGFDESLFDKLMYDRVDDASQSMPTDKIIVDKDSEGKRLIFASEVLKYMKVNCQNDKKDDRWNGIWKTIGENRIAKAIFDLIGKQGNKNEFELLLASDVASTEHMNKATSKNERCIYVEDLRAFYKDSKSYMTRKLAEKSKKIKDEVKESVTIKR